MKLSLLIPLLLAACAAHAPAPVAAPGAPLARVPSAASPLDYAAEKLAAKGVSKEFLALLRETYREDQRQQVLELNLLGFLQTNRATGNETIPGWEIARVQKFLTNHRRTFREAEREFSVPKEVIASLLWVETRHGRDTGRFHVGSALFSIVQADYPALLDGLLDTARKKAAHYDQAIETRIRDRARSKGEWAAAELVALQEVHQRGWKNARTLHGSFSGAFGMAQFLPSSYLAWSKGRHDKPNLFVAEDSILSVANYLSSNGFKPGDRPSQEGALFHYNRDKAYVTHILKLSECLKRRPAATPRGKRRTASIPSC